MGVIEIEYEPNKINVFTKSDEEPNFTGLHIGFASSFKSFGLALACAAFKCACKMRELNIFQLFIECLLY